MTPSGVRHAKQIRRPSDRRIGSDHVKGIDETWWNRQVCSHIQKEHFKTFQFPKNTIIGATNFRRRCEITVFSCWKILLWVTLNKKFRNLRRFRKHKWSIWQANHVTWRPDRWRSLNPQPPLKGSLWITIPKKVTTWITRSCFFFFGSNIPSSITFPCSWVFWLWSPAQAGRQEQLTKQGQTETIQTNWKR